ncbi:MAG: exonuclease SbcCD subunit D C-terminal domain-containing protein [Myxococcales bacterium]|nr:exonuclease SbcCD subunit D C-terminal domain-containing protein [Myxococcales bacterium]
MRILHTADWHLGHTLHGVSREVEHRAFLVWLVECIARESIDVLLVAGDLFDSANPPASAMELWYDFIAAAKARAPALNLIFVAGNHDSAARLDAPCALLRAFGVHVVGRLPRGEDGAIDAERLLIPLRDARGETVAHCAAVPYIRPADLPAVRGDADPYIEGVRQVYASVFRAAMSRRQLGQALVATGHLYMVDSAVSELSERRILGGSQQALPHTLFPRSLTYVALGHMHLAQAVGADERIRYCGSPIPLALDEEPYPHQVVVVEIDAGRLHRQRSVRVPRMVEIWRLPSDGYGRLEDVEALIESLPLLEVGRDDATRPFLELRVHLGQPEPALRQRLAQRLEGRLPRLLKLSVSVPGPGDAAPASPLRTLSELSAEEVFEARCREQLQCETPEALRRAFGELLVEIENATDVISGGA